MEIVAEYQGKVTPDVFANVLNDLGREYNDCLAVVENNSVGFAVLEKLMDLNYPNLYFSIKSTHEFIEQYQAENISNSVAGFTTSSKTRPLIIAKMEEFVRNNLIKIYSSRLLNEMRTFIWNNGKPEAMRSYNDDLIMACAVGCWVRDTALTSNLKETEYSKAFLTNMKKTNSELDTRIPGMLGRKNLKMTQDLNKQAKAYDNFPWLFKG